MATFLLKLDRMNRNLFLSIGIILLVLALAGGVILFRSLKLKAPSAEPTPTPTQLAIPTSTTALTPEEKVKSALEQIKEAFAEKYNKPIEDVDVNISENTGTHAIGGVRFAGEMGGAMWLAYNNGEEWIITYDGHGTIPCSAVDPYDFPADMVPECWDEATEGLYYR